MNEKIKNLLSPISLLAFIIALATAVAAYYSKQEYVLICALVAAATTLWSAYQQNLYQNELGKKHDQLAEKQNIITQQTRDLMQFSSALAQMSTHTVNLVTGGESYAYLRLGIPSGTSKLGNMHLEHKGGYPLSDVTVQIADIDKHPRMDIAVYDIGNIGSIRDINIWMLDKYKFEYDITGKDFLRLNIIFYARNGMWVQELRYKKINNHWTTANRVSRYNYKKQENDILLQEIPPNFPLNESGEVDW